MNTPTPAEARVAGNAASRVADAAATLLRHHDIPHANLGWIDFTITLCDASINAEGELSWSDTISCIFRRPDGMHLLPEHATPDVEAFLEHVSKDGHTIPATLGNSWRTFRIYPNGAVANLIPDPHGDIPNPFNDTSHTSANYRFDTILEPIQR